MESCEYSSSHWSLSDSVLRGIVRHGSIDFGNSRHVSTGSASSPNFKQRPIFCNCILMFLILHLIVPDMRCISGNEMT